MPATRDDEIVPVGGWGRFRRLINDGTGQVRDEVYPAGEILDLLREILQELKALPYEIAAALDQAAVTDVNELAETSATE